MSLTRKIVAVAALSLSAGAACYRPSPAPPSRTLDQSTGAATPPAVTIGSGELSQPELSAQAGPDGATVSAVDGAVALLKQPRPVAARPVQVPVYGPFGRFRGYRTVQPQPPTQQGGSCAGGRCR